MPPKTLFRAGVLTLLVGILLFWIPIWLSLYSWSGLVPILFWFCLSLAGAGGLLILRAALSLLFPRGEPDRRFSMFPGMILRNVLTWRRHRPIPFITQLPNFGLIYGTVIWILIFLFMIFRAPRQSYGLPIDLQTHDFVVWGKSPWPETLSIYLAVGEKYYINGQPVPRDALRARLQQELSHRMVWTVYFEADYDTLNMNAIYAMDTIQGLGAKLIWITPKVREELRQKQRDIVRVPAR